ncbi:unnamed protein product [Mesocestoides corti]|uniref:omega-amidase n=1 Tax=Mesocestoides corti TaxID=53468 RepID=A0A0R3UK38_MESCO|nr:unnamed protein product [Mesocestoides corti]
MAEDKVLRVALCQMKVGSHKQTNHKTAVGLIEEAIKEHGAELVILPECFNSPYGTQYFPEYAEKIPEGRTCELMGATAKRHGIWLIAGSIPEKAADGKLYNTSVTFNPQGEIVGTYRKLHLFDINIPGKITFKESETLSPGSNFLAFQVTNKAGDPFTVGIGICYDVRFSELALVYSRQMNADLIVYPGAFNTTTGPLHWELLARGRALDNQCYVAMCSPAQDLGASYVSHAESLVVSPWAAVLANAGKNVSLLCDWLSPMSNSRSEF